MGLVCLCVKPNMLNICMLNILAVHNRNMDNKKWLGLKKIKKCTGILAK
jgi:hypothetical protein